MMGSHHGTCEILELEDEPKFGDLSKKNRQAMADDKGKKPQVNKSVEDDINKLFEAINVRTSFHGLTLTNSAGNTPRGNPSKKPMRVSTSSSLGIGYSETVSLKQALRGHCISQASEMAAMKRLSLKPSGSPALSDFRKLANASTFVKTSESGIYVDQFKEVKATTSNSSRKTPNCLQEHTVISHTEISTQKVGAPVRLNEILCEPETEKDSSTVNKATVKKKKPSTSISNNKLVKKSTRVSPRAVKTVIRNKQTVKKKSRQESPSSVTMENVTLVCKRCHCSLKDTEKDNNTNLKHEDKSEFTQSSNSSIGEISSSTSISEESIISRCSIGNKHHMSMDIRWQAVRNAMKQNGFLGLKHFNLLKKLGSGDIGTVYLAELMGTNCVFAIKVMDNEFLERRKKMARAHTEREIMRILDHPFLPKLYAHFVSENLSCLVMEYCPGGDLHVLRQRQPGGYYHEQAARFYVAEVLVALEYLHMLGIIYRDLKPENILVREDGHIMLTDFDLSLRCSVIPTLLQSPSSVTMEPPRISGAPCAGSNCIDPFCIESSCQVSCFKNPRKTLPSSQKAKPQLKTTLPQLVVEPTEARSNSFVGTHEYLAPEIIKGNGHGSCVDWWTFGIFLYELLYGKTPFKGLGNDETLVNVVLKTLEFPDTPLVSFQARDLIKGLLVKEPENRLGSQKGAVEIKQHPFFDGLNWALIRCAIPPDVPQSYDVKSASQEKVNKYLEYTGGNLEFEVF